MNEAEVNKLLEKARQSLDAAELLLIDAVQNFLGKDKENDHNK